jgi:hypothetical protein
MRKPLLILLVLLVSSGCIQKRDINPTQFYLDSTQVAMNELSQNLGEYLTSRSLYNNGTITGSEAYDSALMASMKNNRIVNRLNRLTPPKNFDKFHSLVLSSAQHFGSAYNYDMECIKTVENKSCVNAKEEVRLATDLSNESIRELEKLGVRLH